MDTKVASFTAEECVIIRVALNIAEITLKRLIKENNPNKTIYERELDSLLEAKSTLVAALRRDPEPAASFLKNSL